MQDTINQFIRDILAQKNMTGVDPEVTEQLVKDMSVRLNDQINRAILSQLSADQLKEFEKLVSSGVNDAKVQDFLSKTDIDTAKTAADVMKTFREGYLGA